MEIYVVMQSFPEVAAVNDDLDIIDAPFERPVGYFLNKENAERYAEELQLDDDRQVEELLCDPTEFYVQEIVLKDEVAA